LQSQISPSENAFKDKNFEAFAEDIDNAVFFLKSLNFDKDTIHWKILELAVLQLEGLQEGASNGSITDLDVLRMVFFKTDQSITAYHLAIVKTYFHEVNEKKQGLERLQRALIRLDNSIQYHTYEFTEQELVNLAAIRKEIANADKPTLQLWNKVNAFFNRTGQKTKNQFSENY